MTRTAILRSEMTPCPLVRAVPLRQFDQRHRRQRHPPAVRQCATSNAD